MDNGVTQITIYEVGSPFLYGTPESVKLDWLCSNVNEQIYLHVDTFGNTLLLNAILCEHNNFAKELIKVGVNVNVTTMIGNTPLHLASQNGSGDIVSLLLNANANINVPNRFGCTPLDYAIGGGYAVDKGYVEVVKLLLDATLYE